ncbi:Zinc finger protein MSN4 [Holothuria leucospilota]|uniref:Zinc finger protein MSN4 n=1 Tax=Holothuria leucospilota TaxID=206669 RepID=A0A9Q1CT86_HOLLE|nr:Zinc finger protein MSN4 [Holothuria leucospilota]
MAFECKLCEKVFCRFDHLKRHLNSVHTKDSKLQCGICFKTFSRKDSLRRHLKTHETVLTKGDQVQLNSALSDVSSSTYPVQPDFSELPDQTLTASATGSISSNEKFIEKPTKGNKRKRENTGETKEIVASSKRLKTSESVDFTSLEDPAEAPPNIDEHVSILQFPEGVDCSAEDVKKLCRKHWNTIRTKHRRQNKLRDTYNFRLMKTPPEELLHQSKMIFEDQKSVFKLNVGLGFFLRNIETCELRYYYASNNSKLFSEPFLIRNTQTLEHFNKALLAQDLLEHARLQRPNSKWVVEVITNVTYFVYKLPDHPIGCVTMDLPDFVKNNKALTTLERNRKTGERYKDNLCLFRCLALFRGSSPNSLEKETKKLCLEYSRQDPDNFGGIPLKELSSFEDTFKVNVVVYELIRHDVNDGDSARDATKDLKLCDSAGANVTARLVRRSLERYDNTLYVNLSGKHFSYISNIKMYTKTYLCTKCQKLWKDSNALLRHEMKCEGKGSKHKFPGGVFQIPKTVFEKLEDEGFSVPETLRYHPYRVVFDFECYFTPNEESIGKLVWEAKHVPLSASVCSNVPGFLEPRCFVSEKNPETLIQSVVDYISQIAASSQAILNESFNEFICSVKQKIDQDQDEWNSIQETYKEERRPKRHHLDVLLDSLTSWMSEIPVLGFNSGSYDINLIKEFFFPYLIETDPVSSVIKRNNNYMCLRTKNLNFLDISNYLAPGFSYDIFLKAFECSQTKGFFPFEWFSPDKLNDPQLPPHEAFYSDLKQSNISVEEYMYCQKVWREGNMKTMRDFLVWYNNRDVEPFVEALEKMANFYKERGIDAFKDGISVPGLTMKYLFKISNNPPFQLIDEKNKDLYYMFRDNLVGGPSIIFNRYQEKGKTFIRNNPKHICQKVVGYDANALYLWAIMQDMPTGSFTRRKADNGFKVTRTRPISNEWLEWKAFEGGVKIRHAMNNTEKRIGLRRIPVDGFCKETNTVLQFHGCYYHGHDCHLTRGKQVNAKNGVPMKELF